MKNEYLLRRKAELNDHQQITQRIVGQFYVDTLDIALSRYTKLHLGNKRIQEINELWAQVRREHFKAITNDPEADVAQEHLDQGLIQITKDPAQIVPFPERYPELRKPTYGKKGKR